MPEVDVNVEQPIERPPLNEMPTDGPGSGRSQIRRQLEKSFEDSRKAAEPPARRQPQKSRARQEMEELEKEPAETEGETGEQEVVEQETQENEPPAAWTKEAKEEWQNVPPTVQQAILKREQDSSKGVEQLKKQYAEIDEALKPHMETLKQNGHTAAQGIKQLFSWFDALAADQTRVKNGQPPVAFTALAQSFGLNPYQLFGGQQPQQTQQTQQEQKTEEPVQTEQENIPPALKAYLDNLDARLKQYVEPINQKIGNLETTFQRDSQAKTNEILANWSKDKPYFEEVRMMMAHLLQSGVIPPLSNGAADLDKAYDYAINAIPEVRNKLRAEEAAKADAERKAKADAERKAQQEQADKARKANIGLGPSAPGAPVQKQKASKGKSVKESLLEAIEAHRE